MNWFLYHLEIDSQKEYRLKREEWKLALKMYAVVTLLQVILLFASGWSNLLLVLVIFAAATTLLCIIRLVILEWQYMALEEEKGITTLFRISVRLSSTIDLDYTDYQFIRVSGGYSKDDYCWVMDKLGVRHYSVDPAVVETITWYEASDLPFQKALRIASREKARQSVKSRL